MLPNQDEQVLLFLQLQSGINFSKKLEHDIRREISLTLSPRHVPKYIFQVPHIPYNMNGKKLEVHVRRVVSGQPIDARIKSTLEKQTDLDVFKQYVKLREVESEKRAKL